MENNHKLGLYVSYYLSRFDREAYQNLGYGNQLETHNKIGELLSVNPHTVKNWRGNIYTSIQINWSVSQNQFAAFND